MPNEQNPNITPEGENYGLPENFVPVDAPPIIPVNIGANQNPYLSGSIPSNLNLQPDLIATDVRGGRVPSVRLMPVQGNPAVNAQTQSIVEKAIAAIPPTVVPTVTQVTDGLTHGEPSPAAGSWESDPAYIILRDEFTGFHPNENVPVSPYIGQLGWALNMSSGTVRNMAGYSAGNTGIVQLNSTTSPATGESIILDGGDASSTATQGFPLTYVGGWQAEFVFKYPKFIALSPFAANPKTHLRLYIGFASSLVPNSNSEILAPRPAGFIGLRYDTDPNVWALSSAANASGGNTVYTGVFTGVGVNALVGELFTVAGFVANVSNNGSFTCVANTASQITLNNPAGVSESHAATATGPAFSDASYQFEATQNQYAGSNVQGSVVSTGIVLDNNWHRFRMRSLVAGTILFSLDGGTETSIAIGAQTWTAGSGSGQSFAFTQAYHSGSVQVVNLSQSENTIGGSVCPGTPLVISGVTGGTLPAFNGTWNTTEQQPLSLLYFDASPIASNAGGNSSTGTATFYNAFAPFLMIMTDSSGAAANAIQIDFFSFVWNPNLSTAGGTPIATNPRFW